jgi:hypothetical protein
MIWPSFDWPSERSIRNRQYSQRNAVLFLMSWRIRRF